MDAAISRPKAVIFDLDGCLWYPDMYMLWGGGAPFSVESDDRLLDRNSRPVDLLGAVPEILLELHTSAEWEGVVVGIASCTDEPSWAEECLQKFKLADGKTTIKDVMQVEAIYKANKRLHLKNIAEETGVALDEILFLDNEYGNCQDVSSIGVMVAYTPDGVTREAWDKALKRWPAPGEIVYGAS